MTASVASLPAILHELDVLLATQGKLQFARENYDEAAATVFGVALLDFLRVHGMEVRRRLATAGEAVELTVCCGREECGGECGNEWRGTEWVRKATPVEQVDANFLRHVASVCRGAVDLCEPKPQRTPEDDREYNGGLCLSELANIADEIDRRLATTAGSAQGEAVAWRIHWSPQFPDGFELTSNRKRVDDCRALDNAPRIEPLYTTPPPAPAAEQAEFPECSGDPASCPENEGHGCCKRNDGSQWQPEARGVEGEPRAILQWIMREAEAMKELCGSDPESSGAIRNGRLASIAQAAAQALGIVRGPSYATPNPVRAEQPERKWKLVPVEPTREMQTAGKHALKGAADSPEWQQSLSVYGAMLAAAPAAPGAVGVDAIDDAMAERAWRAGREEYSSRVKLSREWDEPDANDIASMRAALTAALAGKDASHDR